MRGEQTQHPRPEEDRPGSRAVHTYDKSRATLSDKLRAVVDMSSAAVASTPLDVVVGRCLQPFHARRRRDSWLSSVDKSDRLQDWASQPLDEEIMLQIERDLKRTLPESTLSLESLRRVLHAHACRHPELGYTQGLNFICARLLLQGSSSSLLAACTVARTEEESFWLLCAVTSKLLPEHFDPLLIGVRTDALVLNALVRSRSDLRDLLPKFEAAGFSLEMVTPQWFMLLFSETLPLESTLAIWDQFFAVGSRVLLATAIALLRCQADAIRDAGPDLNDIYLLLRAPNNVPTTRLLALVEAELTQLSLSKLDALRQHHRPEVAGNPEGAVSALAWVGAGVGALGRGGAQGLKAISDGVFGAGQLTGRGLAAAVQFIGTGVEMPVRALFGPKAPGSTIAAEGTATRSTAGMRDEKGSDVRWTQPANAPLVIETTALVVTDDPLI